MCFSFGSASVKMVFHVNLVDLLECFRYMSLSTSLAFPPRILSSFLSLIKTCRIDMLQVDRVVPPEDLLPVKSPGNIGQGGSLAPAIASSMTPVVAATNPALARAHPIIRRAVAGPFGMRPARAEAPMAKSLPPYEDDGGAHHNIIEIVLDPGSVADQCSLFENRVVEF